MKNITVPDDIELFEEGNYNILNKYDKMILKDHIEAIIYGFEDKMDICLQYLLNINQFYGSDREINYLLVETILNLILRVPNNQDKNIYYSSILLHLTKNNKNCHILLMEVIENNILKNSQNMDVESIDNFCLFFSLYISNQQFTYEYEKLEELLSQNTKSYIFVKIFIDKLCNLGTITRITETITAPLKQLIPEEDRPHWK